MSAPKPAATKVAAKPAAKSAAKASAKTSAKPATSIGVPAASAHNAADQDTSETATRLARDIDRALNEGHADGLDADALQALMAAVCRSYSAKIEAGGHFLPLADRSRVTSTDVMVTASGLLKAANLAVFELGMWQSWTGR
jgi:hypothetical protein